MYQKYFYYPHYRDEENEAERGKGLLGSKVKVKPQAP